ncbi:MAG: tyrosine-type recombinase/integrase [Rhizobiaceae bacterium]
MPGRSIHKLTDKEVAAKKTPGRFSDGGGLYIYVAASVGQNSGRRWVFRWTPTGGSRKEMGLGPYPTVTLAKARAKAQEFRTAIAEGRDPLAERRAVAIQEKPKTFGEAADEFIAIAKKGFRNPKHGLQWQMTLGPAYCKSIRDKPVADISTEDVLKILTLIWSVKSETAARLRARIERVLSYAAQRAGASLARTRPLGAAIWKTPCRSASSSRADTIGRCPTPKSGRC